MTDKTIYERVQSLEQEVIELKKQVAELQKAAGLEIPVNLESVQEEIVEKKTPQAEIPVTVVPKIEEPKPIHESSDSLVDEENVGTESLSGGLEGKLGKRIMSILASILIFCSLVLFGNLVQPYLTPETKTAMMFVLSIILAVFGLWKMQDVTSRYSTLYTAIAACGVGAIYISGIVSRFILGTFTDLTLLIVIAIWIVGVLVLVKFKSGIFSFICYAGIVIATMLAAFNWSDSILGIVVYVAAIAVLFALNFSKELKKVCWLILQMPIVCYGLLFAYSDHIGFLCIIYGLLLVAILAVILYYKVEVRDNILMMANITLYAVSLYIFRSYIAMYWTQYEPAMNIIFAISCIIICTLLYRYYNTESKLLFIVPFFASVFGTWQLNYSEFYSQYIGYMAFFIPLLALGAILRNKYIRYTGYAFMFLYLLTPPHTLALSLCNLMLPYLLVLACMIAWCWKNYNDVDKHILTMLLCVAIFMFSVDDYIDISMCFVLYGVVCISTNLQWYRRNPKNGEDEKLSIQLGYIINEVLVFSGILMISSHDMFTGVNFFYEIPNSQTLGLCLVILMTLALACFNIKRLYDSYGEEYERILSVYTGLKLTLLAFVILNRLHSVGFVISLVGIVLAIAFICIGFRYKLKGFRLYGLVLCLICVAKLLLIDVTYSSSIMRPVGYLAAGLLCYLISWIYSRLEKKL